MYYTLIQIFNMFSSVAGKDPNPVVVISRPDSVVLKND